MIALDETFLGSELEEGKDPRVKSSIQSFNGAFSHSLETCTEMERCSQLLQVGSVDSYKEKIVARAA